ncbi:MAG: hypothetical protein H7Z38_19555 [Rubrivivax sp.]|nr:hypothetical protein [Pyrinomonadaceae bacterium]
MSAEVLLFKAPARFVEAQRHYPAAVTIEPEESTPSRIRAEILYRIFCAEDEPLQSLAMEYFLLECD